jgi:hypothetical protein
MQMLAHLMLAGNSMTSSGAATLCAGCAKNSSLATMSLNHNDLRDEGLKAVLHCLERNAGLVDVRIDNTNSAAPLRIAIEMLLEARRDDQRR